MAKVSLVLTRCQEIFQLEVGHQTHTHEPPHQSEELNTIDKVVHEIRMVGGDESRCLERREDMTTISQAHNDRETDHFETLWPHSEHKLQTVEVDLLHFIRLMVEIIPSTQDM